MKITFTTFVMSPPDICVLTVGQGIKMVASRVTSISLDCAIQDEFVVSRT